MFNELHVNHFWRGMYIDVVSFVKNCDKCSDAVDVVRRRQASHATLNDDDDEDEEDIEDPAPLSPKAINNTLCLRTRSQNTDTPTRVWRKVNTS